MSRLKSGEGKEALHQIKFAKVGLWYTEIHALLQLQPSREGGSSSTKLKIVLRKRKQNLNL